MTEKENVDRRKWLKVTGGTVAGLVVGGALGYLAKPAEIQTVTSTVTRTVTGTAPPPVTAPPPSKPVTLKMINCDYDVDKWLPKIISDYKAYRQANGMAPVEIEYRNSPTDVFDATLASAVAAGEQIDAIYLDTHYNGALGRRGFLVDLFPLVPKSLLDRFVPAYLQTVIDGGGLDEPRRLFSLPNFMTCYALYYNKKIFSDAGLTVPDWQNDPQLNGISWDEIYKTYAPKIQKAGYAAFVEPGSDPWQFGSAVFQCMLPQRFDNKTAQGVYALMTGRERYDGARFTQVIQDGAELQKICMKGFEGMKYEGTVEAFATGKAALTLGSAWWRGAIDEVPDHIEYGILPPPHRPPNHAEDIGGAATSFALTRNAANLEEALKFIMFAVEPAQQMTYLSTAFGGGAALPSLKEMTDQYVSVWRGGEETYRAFSKLASITGVFSDWLFEPEVFKSIAMGVQAAAVGQATAKQIAADVQAAHDRNVKEGKNYYPQV